jgi:hypothetical protein
MSVLKDHGANRLAYLRVLQNSHQNGGSVFLIFVADPRTIRVCRRVRRWLLRERLGRLAALRSLPLVVTVVFCRGDIDGAMVARGVSHPRSKTSNPRAAVTVTPLKNCCR